MNTQAIRMLQTCTRGGWDSESDSRDGEVLLPGSKGGRTGLHLYPPTTFIALRLLLFAIYGSSGAARKLPVKCCEPPSEPHSAGRAC